MKEDKSARILYIYIQLNANKVLNKQILANYFNVSKRTIQRDISDLNKYLDEEDLYSQQEIIYNQKENNYSLSVTKEKKLEMEEIAMVCKILLGSRALTKNEMNKIVDKLIKYIEEEDRKTLQYILNNEVYHYTELQHKKPLLKQMYEVIKAINSQRKIKIGYTRQDGKFVERIIHPLNIIFSEYYLYLIATRTDYNHGPLIYRMDRIDEYTILEEKYRVIYSDRFQEGEFRKQVQFMYPGNLQHVKLKFWGASVAALLDRLPTAEIIDSYSTKEENRICYIVKTTVYGKGIIMWLLSQGDKIEVLEPKELRDDIKNIIINLSDIYK